MLSKIERKMIEYCEQKKQKIHINVTTNITKHFKHKKDPKRYMNTEVPEFH